jgi:aspartate/methionine/tyrosine aminotransferase
MNLSPFRIEQYFAKHEFTAKYMLSSSDCESKTIQEILNLEPGSTEKLHQQWLGYTESSGTPYLRQTITSMYSGISSENVLVLSSAEEGIYLFYKALLNPGDHVIVETPCYESAIEVARGAGATISFWERKFENAWANDLDALEKLLQPNTKAIYINTPSNPTGTCMILETLEQLMNLARDRDIMVFCDEVYRELEHDPTSRLPAACELYENAVSLGSISKTYGLPGLRTGWLVTRNPTMLEKLLQYRLYTTICNSAPTELLTNMALRHRHILSQRNLEIVQHNLPLLDALIQRQADKLEWIRPTASPIGFPKIVLQLDVTQLCDEIVRDTGVMILPGAVYDCPQHIRLGFGRKNMPEALEIFEAYLLKRFS